MASPALNNKVGFLVGLESAISGINTNRTATPGHFYLTSDAHRLYIGNSDGSISPVNEGVTVVTSISNLPNIASANDNITSGHFYYATTENVLCVYSGGRWVQINPDTYLLRNTSAVSGSVVQTNSVTIRTEVKDTNDGTNAAYHGGLEDEVSGSFTIAGGGTAQVSWNSTTNTVTVSTPEGGIYDLLTEVNSSTGNPQLVLVKYVDAAKTQEAQNGRTAIQLIGDPNDYVSVGRDSNGNITITGVGMSTNTIEAHTSGNGIYFTIEDVGGDSVPTPTITPSVTLKNADGTSTQPVYFTNTISGTAPSQTVSQVANLNVYTKDAVDALIAESMQDAEGMYFYGTLGSGGTKPTFASLASATDVRSGATLKIVEDSISTSGVTITGLASGDQMEVGDMIIVTGQEYQNTNSNNATTYLDPTAAGYNAALIGTLVPSTRIYTYIPSGNDVDVYWTPDVHSAEKTVTWSHSNGTNVEQIVFAPATNSQVTVSSSNASSGGGAVNTQTLTIGHKNMYSGNTNTSAPTVTTLTTSTRGNGGEQLDTKNYTAVTGLTLENGHITGYETTQITLTSNRLKKVLSTASTTANSNIVKLTNTYYDDEDNDTAIPVTKNDWQISSDSLQITVGTNSGSITTSGNTTTALAADIHVDMVWGTFS